MNNMDTTVTVGTEGHIDHGSTAPDSTSTFDFAEQQQKDQMQQMVKSSVMAHSLLKQGKSVKNTAAACNLPISLVQNMAQEINKPEIIALRNKDKAKRKLKRKSQSTARKANRNK